MAFLQLRKRPRSPAVPKRVYAVGDIHGRADLLKSMVEAIRHDTAQRPHCSTRLIILGDFIDRGPGSAIIIDILMRLRDERNLIVLKGNHEAAMADALLGSYAALDLWLEHGGLATLASFGVDVAALDLDDSYATLQIARQAVPADVRAWLQELPTHVQFGGYYFVHAGIMPGVPLAKQSDEDRLWIADDFTTSDSDHGAIIVHGHTINEHGVHIAHNRIGVDTGAYRTNRLSAIAIEGAERWVITATGEPLRSIWPVAEPAPCRADQ